MTDIAKIIQQGGFAAVALLALTAVVYLWRKLDAVQTERIAELRSVVTALAANEGLADALREHMEAQNNKRDRR